MLKNASITARMKNARGWKKKGQTLNICIQSSHFYHDFFNMTNNWILIETKILLMTKTHKSPIFEMLLGKTMNNRNNFMYKISKAKTKRYEQIPNFRNSFKVEYRNYNEMKYITQWHGHCKAKYSMVIIIFNWKE